jgi:hypothetical protein
MELKFLSLSLHFVVRLTWGLCTVSLQDNYTKTGVNVKICVSYVVSCDLHGIVLRMWGLCTFPALQLQ